MRTLRTRHAVAATSFVLLATVLSGCGGDSSEPQTGAATSKPVPSQGSPFDAELVSDSGAEVGATMTATLTNQGRLPDAYQVSVDPPQAATVPVADFRLSPGESARVRIKVKATPFDVHLKSVGGGGLDVVAFTVS
jgi:hypothetical protein